MVRVIWCALSATCFCVYVLTMFPTISGGDSGELMTVACNFGVAHPPGYPLWTWLAAAFVHAASIAPHTTPAWRVGLLSAACNSCAAVVLAMLTRIVLGRGVSATACAVLAAGCFAFSPNVWRYAGQAEVFGLNNLLVALFLYGLARFNAVPTGKIAGLDASAARQHWAHVTALCCGLALTNQHTGILYVLPVAVCVAGRLLWLRELSIGRTFSLVLCGLVAMLPYAHLPIVARRRVQDAWGDQSTWDGFVTHFLRREYGTFVLASLHELGQKQGTLEAMKRLQIWYQDFGLNTIGMGPPLALVGAFSALLPTAVLQAGGQLQLFPRAHYVARMRGGTATVPLLLVMLMLYLGVMSMLANLPVDNAFHLGILARMWQQADLVACVLVGVGAHACWCTVIAILDYVQAHFGLRNNMPCASQHKSRSSTGSMDDQKIVDTDGDVPTKSSTKIITSPAFLCATVFTAVLCGTHFAAMDNSANVTFERYGRVLLHSMPRGALLLVNEDINYGPVKYVQQCHGMRRDVRIVSIPLITYTWWRKTQLHHHKGLIFPGARHHPFETDRRRFANPSFDMRTFLHANIIEAKSDVYIAGDWKTGDSSQDIFERVPFGLVDRVLAPGLTEKVYGGRKGLKRYERELRATARRAASDTMLEAPPAQFGKAPRTIAVLAALAPEPRLATADSWERVVQRKLISALSAPAHFIAERFSALTQSEQQGSKRPRGTKLLTRILRRAHERYAILHRVVEEGATSSSKELRDEALVAPNVWRNGGVIAGELAARMPIGSAEHTDLVDNMFTLWRTFVVRERAEAGASNAISEIEHLISDGINPFDHRGKDGAQRRDDAARSAARGRVVCFRQIGKDDEHGRDDGNTVDIGTNEASAAALASVQFGTVEPESTQSSSMDADTKTDAVTDTHDNIPENEKMKKKTQKKLNKEKKRRKRSKNEMNKRRRRKRRGQGKGKGR